MSVDVAARHARTLTRATGSGSFRGLVGLTGAELRRWFPGRVVVFTTIGVGIAAAVFAIWSTGANAADPRLGAYVFSVFAIWMAVLVLVMVATTQGAMANEIEDGTAAWVVAKPVGRPAFVLSKFVAAVPGVVIGAVALPGVVVRGFMAEAQTRGDTEFTAEEVIRLLETRSGARGEFTTLPSIERYLGSLTLMTAILLFIVAVMILLGCVVRSRAALFLAGLAIPIGLLVYSVVGPEQVVELTPAWAFDSLRAAIADDPAPVLAPTLVAGAWTVGVMVLAMVWFSRREL